MAFFGFLLTLFCSFLVVAKADDFPGYDIEEPLLYDTFPEHFDWGVATASYQIEGAWNEGGKSPSIWDVFTANPGDGHIIDGSDGTVACDSYHKFREDVQLIKQMNVSHYRFSIAWTRILTEDLQNVNPEGVEYYNHLIDDMLANGITPVATLYHWDLPQVLQEQEGGWLNADVASHFQNYARVCFEQFGDRVKQWITLNEPWVTSTQGYGSGTKAPGNVGPGTDEYVAAHNQIRAHAKAYRTYHSEFHEQGGRVGITLNMDYYEPLDPTNESHAEAAQTYQQFAGGWFANPILVNGMYPDIMRQMIDMKSEQQGFAQSRLPQFTEEESLEIANSADFLGINYYTSQLVYPTDPEDIDISQMGWQYDTDAKSFQDHRWYSAASSWLKITPFGLRRLMNWLKATYGSDIEIYITENGFSDFLGNLDDQQRIYYYKHYINQLLKAIKLDECNIKGYYAWSLLDNFEWAQGYTEKFGLHSVDFNDPQRPRTPKASAKFFRQLVSDNGFVERCNV